MLTTADNIATERSQRSEIILFAKLLLAFPEVDIHTAVGGGQFIVIRALLHFLRSQPLPNLRHFNFWLFGGEGRADTDIHEVKHIELRGYNLRVKRDDFDYHIFDVEMPQHFPPGTKCQIMLKSDCMASLYCGVGYGEEKDDEDEDEEDWEGWKVVKKGSGEEYA